MMYHTEKDNWFDRLQGSNILLEAHGPLRLYIDLMYLF